MQRGFRPMQHGEPQRRDQALEGHLAPSPRPWRRPPANADCRGRAAPARATRRHWPLPCRSRTSRRRRASAAPRTTAADRSIGRDRRGRIAPAPWVPAMATASAKAKLRTMRPSPLVHQLRNPLLKQKPLMRSTAPKTRPIRKAERMTIFGIEPKTAPPRPHQRPAPERDQAFELIDPAPGFNVRARAAVE